MVKRILSGIFAFLLMFCLCGCDFFTADIAELLSPPALSDDLKQISKAIINSVGESYNLQYPQSGEYRSAVVQKDIDGDGKNEAIAFYSTNEDETQTMSINIVCNSGGSWKSEGQQSIVASGVHKVDFCDLDQDGISEILVGWQIYGTSEMQLAVYSFVGKTLSQRMLNKYTHFVTCNLDDNETFEILIVDANANKAQNTASLYGLSDKGVVLEGRCALDSKVQSFGQPVVAELSSGQKAVYIDSVKGIGSITEVIIYEKGKLLNPLYDEQSTETSLTLRSSNFSTQDFNNDGVLEIPVQLNVPSVSKSGIGEKLYLTNWCSFNGEILTAQVTSLINVVDGYYYNLPASWVGNIAVLKDTDNRIREIYKYDAEKMEVGASLLYIRTINKKDWDKGVYDALNLIKICENGNSIIACRITTTAINMGITLEKVKSGFGIYVQE